MPEIIEIIRNPVEAHQLGYKLVRSAEKELLILFSSSNAFIRQINADGGHLAVEIANSRNISITVLTLMDEIAKKMAKDLEKRSTNIQIRSIARVLPPSHPTITVLIVDRKFFLAVELKDDSKLVPEESCGNTTYSSSKSTVLSYVSMFESFMRLTELYEESQSKLSDTTDELEAKFFGQRLSVVNKMVHLFTSL